MKKTAKKRCYILIHGAWHASWCWKHIVPILAQHGHQVIAPDLPGHGDNPLPFKNISLQTYVDYITQFIAQSAIPVTLVGHSMAGVIISQLAENMPEKIQQLIYISAYIPEDQESLRGEAKKSDASGIAAEMVVHKLEHRIELNISERLIGLFYNTCDWVDANFALNHLREEPSQPFIDPIHITAEKFGTVKKRYILCMHDRIILPQDQRRMYAKWEGELHTLETDHSPFFSAPQSLLAALVK